MRKITAMKTTKNIIALWLVTLGGCAIVYDFSDYRALPRAIDHGPGSEEELIDFTMADDGSGGSSGMGGMGGIANSASSTGGAGGHGAGGVAGASTAGSGGAPASSSSSSSSTGSGSGAQSSSSSGISCALPPPGGCDCFVQPGQWICMTMCQYDCPFCHPGPPWPDCYSAGVIPGTQTWAACCGSH